MSSPPVKIHAMRKMLLAIAKELTHEDIETANFYLRSESNKKNKNAKDLLETLEDLKYFDVSKKEFKGFIEFLEVLDRLDLQMKLQQYEDGLERNDDNKGASVAVSMKTTEEERKSADLSSSEETNLRGNDDNKGASVAVSMKTTEEERKSADLSSSEKTNLHGNDDNKGASVAVSMKTTEEERKSADLSSSEKTNLHGNDDNKGASVAVSMKTTEEERKSADLSSSEETNLHGNDDNKGASVAVSMKTTEEERKSADLSSSEETNLHGNDDNKGASVAVSMKTTEEERKSADLSSSEETNLRESCGVEREFADLSLSEETNLRGDEDFEVFLEYQHSNDDNKGASVAVSMKTTEEEIKSADLSSSEETNLRESCGVERKFADLSLSEETNLRGNDDNKGASVAVSMKTTEEERKSADLSSSEETNLHESCGVERKFADLSLSEETNLRGNNDNKGASVAVSMKTTEEERKSADLSSSEETNLRGCDTRNTRDVVASNLTEYGIGNINPQCEVSRTVDENIPVERGKDQPITPEDLDSDEEHNTCNNPKTEITLYNYQLELGERAKEGKNSIICSVTGSGKTITAASVIKHRLDEAKKSGLRYRVLYLVHIRYLVKHLTLDLAKILGNEVYRFEDDDLLFSEFVQSKSFVILTAQIFLNAIRDRKVRLPDYDLLVFDECHNTTRKHPYNEIMMKYHECKMNGETLPNILGLSATLGAGSDPFKAIIKLCANMDTEWVSCVCNEDNRREMMEKNRAPIIDEVIRCNPRPLNKFSKTIISSIEKFISNLEADYNMKLGDGNIYGEKEFESTLCQLKNECDIKNWRDQSKILDFLIVLNKTLIYYNETTALYAQEYFQLEIVKPNESCLQIEEDLFEEYKFIEEKLGTFPIEDELKNNEKLLKLKLLLQEHLKSNQQKKIIIFCLTRFNAKNLKDIILHDKELSKFVRIDYLIGQSGDDGLSQNQQENVLKRFQDNDLNVLLATSIAGEGLNIPDCEIVIRYLYVTSDISRKQCMGRARKKNSKCFLIIENNSESIQRDYRNKMKEKEMNIALDKVLEMGEEKFKEKVAEEIEELQVLIKERMEASYEYSQKAEDVEIFCKECHIFLCLGSNIIKKGSEYICIDPEFKNKVNIMRTKERKFRHDSNIGNSTCSAPQCNNQFGAIKKYVTGKRQMAYVLNIKSILFRRPGYQDKIQLKKWSEHFFNIKEEPLS